MYIEFVILDNFALTWIAASAASRFSATKIRRWRIAIAAVFGTGAAVAYPFIPLSYPYLLTIKIAVGILLCVILFTKTGRPILSSIYFFGFTFAIGGAAFAAMFIISGSYEKARQFSYNVPLFVPLLCAVFVFFISTKISNHYKARRCKSTYTYRAQLTLYGTKLELVGFLDSGNTVYDTVSGLPVVFCYGRRIAQKLDAGALIRFLKATENAKTVSIYTVSGKCETVLIKPEKFVLYLDKGKNKIVEVVLAVIKKRPPKDCDLILHPEIIV